MATKKPTRNPHTELFLQPVRRFTTAVRTDRSGFSAAACAQRADSLEEDSAHGDKEEISAIRSRLDRVMKALDAP